MSGLPLTTAGSILERRSFGMCRPECGKWTRSFVPLRFTFVVECMLRFARSGFRTGKKTSDGFE